MEETKEFKEAQREMRQLDEALERDRPITPNGEPPFPPLPTNMNDTKKRFEEKFGKAGPEKNCDSIGRGAGCDDCSNNIELRDEHYQFLESECQRREEEMKERCIFIAKTALPSLKESGSFSHAETRKAIVKALTNQSITKI